MIAHPRLSWRSRKHHDGSVWAGWFIAGMNLSTGQITYHIPEKFWNLLEGKVEYLDCAPVFDGHTSDDVLLRLEAWIKGGDRHE
ncbi:hypothetical protein IFO70_10125 [Phormidium tenue FACHB-886]|nr:hypothetical protein [Phormidium tenue FACHB-886]